MEHETGKETLLTEDDFETDSIPTQSLGAPVNSRTSSIRLRLSTPADQEKVLIPKWQRWMSLIVLGGFIGCLFLLALIVSRGFSVSHLFDPSSTMTVGEARVLQWASCALEITGVFCACLFIFAGIFVSPKLRRFPQGLMFSYNLCTILYFVFAQFRFDQHIWCQIEGAIRLNCILAANCFVPLSVVSLFFLVVRTRSMVKWRAVFYMIGWLWPTVPCIVMAAYEQFNPGAWPSGCDMKIEPAEYFLYAPPLMFTPVTIVLLAIVSIHIQREVRLHPYTDTSALLKTLFRFQLFGNVYIDINLFLLVVPWIERLTNVPPIVSILYGVVNRVEAIFYPLLWMANKELLTNTGVMVRRLCCCCCCCSRSQKAMAPPSKSFENLSSEQLGLLSHGALVSLGIQTAI
ncbi:hypothetical protein PAPYR_5941 [Paratrimastix pyriformis]|uniref:Uncharacterized protein n=1 Tax=Paratrimastix pyriformis TaxID=342808 RepID=A0ABQ8UGK7_9EUKA|nr:hypothetical protein PAPYR_5941 [Paratrimastix pyriformis]